MFLLRVARPNISRRVAYQCRRYASSEIATHNLDPASVQASMQSGKDLRNLPFAKNLFLGKFDIVSGIILFCMLLSISIDSNNKGYTASAHVFRVRWLIYIS